MITVRQSQERGRTTESWLDSRHTFSFDAYQDPDHNGFRALRVINEDRVSPDSGFPLHPHRDMEILTFVISGVLEHEDDLGGHERINAGEVQRITAGRGIRHSESNPSSSEEVHLLQIWILPQRRGLEPGYEKKSFRDRGEGDELRLLGSQDGREGSAVIRQEVSLYFGSLEKDREIDYPLAEDRHAWLQLIDGELDLNGRRLLEGDGAAASDEERLTIRAQQSSRFILFDLG